MIGHPNTCSSAARVRPIGLVVVPFTRFRTLRADTLPGLPVIDWSAPFI
ncbi:hypothetical protein [Streptomyces sp. NBC_01408]|nr:hypothetical protein [Streptomyces sp. NBC_01408]